MNVLIVEDERRIRQGIVAILSEEGFTTCEAASITEALEYLQQNIPNVLLCDMYLPDGEGFDVLTALAQMDNAPPCIMMTSFGSRELATEALQKGAYDYVSKPLRFDELLARLHRLEEHQALVQRVETLEIDVRTQGDLAVLGDSHVMQQLRYVLEKAVASSIPVLIQGETGVGKGVVAHLLHTSSQRSSYPFLRVNCAAIPEALMESELFGHRKGSFSGADQDSDGLLLATGKGTLFLDEIGELPLAMQAKLLHVLDDQCFRAVGDTVETPFQGRIVVATNRDLKTRVAQGLFREDLFYRLDILNIDVPPLRERRDDIVPLAMRILASLSADEGRKVSKLSHEQCMWLQAQEWTGNVRELRNTLERALLFSEDGALVFERGISMLPENRSLSQMIEDFERSIILQTLEFCEHDKAKVAKLLDIGVSSLYRKLGA